MVENVPSGLTWRKLPLREIRALQDGKGFQIICSGLEDSLRKKIQGIPAEVIILEANEYPLLSEHKLTQRSFICVNPVNGIPTNAVYYKASCAKGISKDAGLKDLKDEIVSSDDYSKAEIVDYLKNPCDDPEPHDLFAKYIPLISQGREYVSIKISELAQRASGELDTRHFTMAFMTWSKTGTSKSGTSYLLCKIFDSQSSMCLFLWDSAYTSFRNTRLPCVIAIQSQFLRLVPKSPFKAHYAIAYSLSNSAHIHLMTGTEGKNLPAIFFPGHINPIKRSSAQLSFNSFTNVHPCDHIHCGSSPSSSLILNSTSFSPSVLLAVPIQSGCCKDEYYDGGDEIEYDSCSEDLVSSHLTGPQFSDAHSDEFALLQLQREVFGKSRPHVLLGADGLGQDACLKSVWLMFANMNSTFSPDVNDITSQRVDRRTPIIVTFLVLGVQTGISTCDFCHEASQISQVNMHGIVGLTQVHKPSECVHIRTIRSYFQRAYHDVPGMESLQTNTARVNTIGLDCLIASKALKFRKDNSQLYAWKPNALPSSPNIFQFVLERHFSSTDRYCLLQYGYPGTDVFGLVLTGRLAGNLSFCHCITCDSSGCHHAQHIRTVGGLKRSHTRPEGYEYEKVVKRHVAKDGKGLILYGHSKATIPNQNSCVHKFELESMLQAQELKLSSVSKSTDVSHCFSSSDGSDGSDEESCSSCFEADYSSSDPIDSTIAKHDCGLTSNPIADGEVPTVDQGLKGAKGKRGRNDGSDEDGSCFGRQERPGRTSANLKFPLSYLHTPATTTVDWVMYDEDSHEMLHEEKHNSQAWTEQPSYTSPDHLKLGQTFDGIRGHKSAKMQDAQGEYDPEFLRSTSRWYYLQDGHTIRTLGSQCIVPTDIVEETPSNKSPASTHALECLSNLRNAVDQIPSDQRTSESYKALSSAMEGMSLNLHNIQEPSTPLKRYLVFHVGCVYEMPVKGPIENYDGAEDNLIHAAGHMFFTYEFIRVFITQLLVSSTTFHAYIRTALQHYVQSMQGVETLPDSHQDKLLYKTLCEDLAKIERRQGDPRVLVNFRDSVLDAITLQVSKMES